MKNRNDMPDANGRTAFTPRKEFPNDLKTGDKFPKDLNNFEESELKLLNLIAEIIVEIILEETKNECDRIRSDQH